MATISVIVFLSIFSYVTSFEFVDPKQQNIEFGDKTDNIQSIIVDEDNAGAIIKLLIISSVDGDLHTSYDSSIKQLLQPLLAKSTDSEYALIINRVDYENLKIQNIQPNFLIDIFQNNEIENKQSVNISIKNIDDEKPTLTVTPCYMNEELGISVQIPQFACVFHVSDPDGFLEYMDFSTIIDIEGDSSNFFALEFKETPDNNVYESDIYLVMQKGQMLDYETRTFYFFEVRARDGAGHFTTTENVQILVQVNDIADNGPIWQITDFNITVYEEESTTIQLKAIDGDIGINNDVFYTLEFAEDFFRLDTETGLLTIDAIDRDEQNLDYFTFAVKAYEVQDFMQIYNRAYFNLIIEDIDDNIPEISTNDSDSNQLNREIFEGSFNITTEIVVNDIDLGENSMFNIELKTSTNPEFLSAFDIVPKVGYKNTNLILRVLQPDKLDFENPEWRTITMEIHTTGTKNPNNTDIFPINIYLIDINDEVPIFDKNEYVISVLENTTVGTNITRIRASDSDAEDLNTLRYEIVDSFTRSLLQIDSETGDVTIIKENAFDYETQTEYHFQIRAIDNANHTSTTQLIIKVEDINDENPRIEMGSNFYQVEENTPIDYEITIKATDDDLTASLTFDMDEDKSYATKNGIKVNDTSTRCFGVVTLAGEDTWAVIKLMQDNYNSCSLDYELFDTFYLYLVLTDRNTQENEGFDTALIVINIVDINDNAPVFDSDEIVLEIEEQTTDWSTTVTAIDLDVNEIITYSMKNVDDTSEYFVIDKKSGVISTGWDVTDCDDPVRYELVYEITASDGLYSSTATIKFKILDINDNTPKVDDQFVTIPEDFVSEVSTISVGDNDRDAPANVVSCIFGEDTNSTVLERFQIESNIISVSLSNGATLDREDLDKFQFMISCFDNVGAPAGSVSFTTMATVAIKLADVNDNHPTIVNTYITGLDENKLAGSLDTRLQGEDLDEGDNALVEFEGITQIWRFLDENYQNEVDVPQQLFIVTTDSTKKEGILTLIAESLKGYYGFLVLEITVLVYNEYYADNNLSVLLQIHDLGTEPLYNSVNVTLEVTKVE